MDEIFTIEASSTSIDISCNENLIQSYFSRLNIKSYGFIWSEKFEDMKYFRTKYKKTKQWEDQSNFIIGGLKPNTQYYTKLFAYGSSQGWPNHLCYGPMKRSKTIPGPFNKKRECDDPCEKIKNITKKPRTISRKMDLAQQLKRSGIDIIENQLKTPNLPGSKYPVRDVPMTQNTSTRFSSACT